MGLEPTTFCMAIVCEFRINACFCGLRLNPITGDYRRFGVYWSPNGPPGVVAITAGSNALVGFGRDAAVEGVGTAQAATRRWAVERAVAAWQATSE
jgi:hypothetical protein